MSREAYILNAESSRRKEKLNNYKVRPPQMLKNDKNWKFAKIPKSIEHINLSL